MKAKPTLYSLFLAILSAATLAHAQGTAFTYQGRLNANGTPVNGAYDFRFSIYAAAAGGNPVAGPLPMDAVDVVNGLFVITRLDFGVGVFTGPARWLEVSVRPAGNGNFKTLDQRLELTSLPYSIRAQVAGVADSIAAGSVVKSLNRLHDDIVLAAVAPLSLTPNGNTLTLSTAGGGGGVWSINANNAYYTAGNVGIGLDNPQERLTIAGVPNYNNGLKLTGNLAGGTGMALENTSSGGHKYSFFSAGSGNAIGAGGFGVYDDTAAAYRLAIGANGNIGIGSATPAAKLDVASFGGELVHLIGAGPSLSFYDSNTGYARHALQSLGGGLNFLTDSYLTGNGPFNYMVINNAGNVGIGSSAPAAKLEVASPGGEVVHLIGGGPSLSFYDSNTGYARHALQSLGGGLNFLTDSYLTGNGPFNYMVINNAGNVGIGTADPQAKLDVNGTTRTKVLTITGGADIAEPFEISASEIAKGSVVVIDADNPGKLKLSQHAYDERVAGVVSGARGVNPGISLYQEGLMDGTQNVALSGRVYVKADASFGAIKPGDLLTTSETPGHAMKVTDHLRARGAVLGKAMSGLSKGTGTVLVLVTLQ